MPAGQKAVKAMHSISVRGAERDLRGVHRRAVVGLQPDGRRGGVIRFAVHPILGEAVWRAGRRLHSVSGRDSRPRASAHQFWTRNISRIDRQTSAFGSHAWRGIISGRVAESPAASTGHTARHTVRNVF